MSACTDPNAESACEPTIQSYPIFCLSHRRGNNDKKHTCPRNASSSCISRVAGLLDHLEHIEGRSHSKSNHAKHSNAQRPGFCRTHPLADLPNGLLAHGIGLINALHTPSSAAIVSRLLDDRQISSGCSRAAAIHLHCNANISSSGQVCGRANTCCNICRSIFMVDNVCSMLPSKGISESLVPCLVMSVSAITADLYNRATR